MAKKKEEEKCCGNCCWLYAEDMHGYGACPFNFGYVKRCSDPACISSYVSDDEMHRHMDVLLQHQRHTDGEDGVRAVKRKDLRDAVAFAYKYLKTFSEL